MNPNLSFSTMQDLGLLGEFKWVKLQDLHIDDRYQRPEVSKRNTRKMADNFRWDKCGVLNVRNRNGILFVVDGNQRLHALILLGVEKAPCIIFPSSGVKDEARAFVAINIEGRVTVPVIRRFWAAVAAGKQPQVDINRYFHQQGIIIDSGKKGLDVCNFISVLMMNWGHDEEACKKAIMCQRAVFPQNQMRNEIHKGLWYLFHRGLIYQRTEADVDQYRETLESRGIRSVMGEIRNYAKEYSNGTITIKSAGLGILEVLNFRRGRNKITLREEA